MPYTNDLPDRARFRKDLHRASEHGGPVLARFLRRNEDLFAPPEWSRILKQAMERGWDNIAYAINHRFRFLRGLPHDPVLGNADRREYPAIIETIITPHKFLRHVLPA